MGGGGEVFNLRSLIMTKRFSPLKNRIKIKILIVLCLAFFWRNSVLTGLIRSVIIFTLIKRIINH